MTEFQTVLPEPAEKEARPRWQDLPAPLVAEIENITGKITQSDIAWGGYSPSACFRVTAADGRRFFIKGSHPGQTTHGAKALRQEVAAYQNLKFLERCAPRFHGTVSFGDEDDWHLAVWDQVRGKTALPWTEEKARRVLELLAELHSGVVRADVPELPHGRESNHVSDFFLGQRLWKRFARKDDSNRQDKFVSLFEDTPQAAHWLEAHLPQLVALQEKVTQITEPEGVVHFDLRSDNILFDEDRDGRAVIVDWTDTCWGPVLFDVALFALCVAAESEIRPQSLLTAYEEMSGRAFEDQAVAAVVATITGYFADNAWRDVPQQLPRLRWIQSLCLDAGLRWLAAEEIVPHPGRFRC
ncbi:MAG: aminoglycoside phosphotransferase family protein [Micavibrio sp.]|nr:MAG: aminoglycoside phosphotransferase family protein [Micavibrio sp.]